MISFCFPEAAPNTVDSGKAFEVADGDFVRRNAHDPIVFLMQVVNVECPTARHDGEFERESCKAGVPWSWQSAKWVSQDSVEDL